MYNADVPTRLCGVAPGVAEGAAGRAFAQNFRTRSVATVWLSLLGLLAFFVFSLILLFAPLKLHHSSQQAIERAIPLRVSKDVLVPVVWRLGQVATRFPPERGEANIQYSCGEARAMTSSLGEVFLSTFAGPITSLNRIAVKIPG